MGSDSRTATASSKHRPSWRNRHLNQLNDEQLNEVRQHRGSEAVVDIPRVASAAAVQAPGPYAEPDESRLPRQQAGPEPGRPELSRPELSQPELSRPELSWPEQADNRQSRREPQQRPDRPARNGYSPEYSGGRQDLDQDTVQSRGESADYRESAGRGSAPHREHQYTQARREDHGSRDRQRYNDERHRYQHTDRYANEPGARAAYRDERNRNQKDTGSSHQRHDLDMRAQRSDDAPELTAESQTKGFAAKILDYQMPAKLKYGLMACAVAIMVAVSLLKPIDTSSQSQLDSAFTRALIGFGLAKTLNGVISVAQGTEFAVQPAGVGVNFSPGEILDPINDLVERFSWVMLLATSSIGVQQILLEVSSWTGVSVLLAGAGLFFLLTRLRNSAMARLADVAGKLLLAMLLVRFLIPVGALANDWVYQQFLQTQFEESSAELEDASDRIREISKRQSEGPDDEGSITDRARRFYSSMTSKFDFDGMLDDYKQSAETVSENAINLIVVFVLQTIIFPLLFLFLIYRLFRFVVLPSRPAR